MKVEYGIDRPIKCKYPFEKMDEVGASLWVANITTQALLTAFKAWCRRSGHKNWKAICWTEKNKKNLAGARIKRTK